MKRIVVVFGLILMLNHIAYAEELLVWQLVTGRGKELTEICYEPEVGDEYVSADNRHYKVVKVEDGRAVVADQGEVTLPQLEWHMNDAQTVSSRERRIGLYCTHSDESYTPSDGYYSTTDRGSIYQVAELLTDALRIRGIDATAADNLHHPHDAGAYRRSRQTAIDLIRTLMPDCLIDIHRDGIPDPAAYETSIGGQDASKIRLLVGRGNQNAELNKEFALTIKAVADRVYPGLIKDIYMGKGAFNQDLLPKSLLFECGTYTIDKERVFVSMPMMADVVDRALYGELIGSVGRTTTDVKEREKESGSVTQGEPDPMVDVNDGTGSGTGFLMTILVIGVVGFAILSAGSLKGGIHKAGRNLREMTGGLIGKKPEDGEDHEHS